MLPLLPQEAHLGAGVDAGGRSAVVAVAAGGVTDAGAGEPAAGVCVTQPASSPISTRAIPQALRTFANSLLEYTKAHRPLVWFMYQSLFSRYGGQARAT